MIGFLLGVGFGFGLHFALCKWGDKCGCNPIQLRKKK
tara:strand:- start:66 stop:176 length:111 start_codon:yes stop_codon:yes gene_type:complete